MKKEIFTARVNYIFITYNDDTNSPIAYEMLNALLPGNNFTWNVNFQRNITSNIQISINYDGRKNEGGKIISYWGRAGKGVFLMLRFCSPVELRMDMNGF